jgi:hypothetical protein
MLTKPTLGAGFGRDRSYLMNMPKDYDDDVEWLQMPMKVLGRPEVFFTGF